MKALWVNPEFLDYRVPLYKELWKLFNGELYILYSKKAIVDRVHKKISSSIGSGAIAFEKDKRVNIISHKDFSNKGIRFHYTRGLYKQIKKINPDVIIAEGFFQWTPISIIYAKVYRKPLLISYERTEYTERNCPLWRKLYRKFINLFVTGYICNGILTKQYLMNVLGVKPDKCMLGNLTADSDSLASKVLPQRKNRAYNTSNGLTFLFVGKITERKGLIYLLSAWEEHTQINSQDTLEIVGGGELLEMFKSQYRHLSSIKFIGSIDYDEIHTYYATADVFIIPTLEDNWSLVVPEAMACGLPIACSIYNGCYPELVYEGENGKLFDPLKQNSIIEALSYFHNVDIECFGKKSIEIESKFSPQNIAGIIHNNIQKIYDSKSD